MQAAERVQLAAAEQRADSQVRAALEAQLEQLRASHASQLAALRDELAALQRQHQDLKEYIHAYTPRPLAERDGAGLALFVSFLEIYATACLTGIDKKNIFSALLYTVFITKFVQ